MSNLRTPLYQWHVDHKARMVPFGGWEMPVQYAGILAEHHAVRTDVGVFDVSHMGEFEVTGPDRNAFVNRITSNDVAELLRTARRILTTLITSQDELLAELREAEATSR